MDDASSAATGNSAAEPVSWQEMRIRRASHADADAVLGLLDYRARWLHAQGIDRQWPVPFPPATIETALGAGHTWVVHDSHESVVATFTVDDEDGLWPDDELPSTPAYLHRLAVGPGLRGLGRFILKRLETDLSAAGYTDLRLDCVTNNSPLCDYYEQYGFRPCAYRTVHAIPGDGWPTGSSAQLTLYELPLEAI